MFNGNNKMQHILAALAVCSLAFAALTLASPLNKNSVKSYGSGNVMNSYASSQSGPAIASNYAAPPTHAAIRTPIRAPRPRAPSPAPAPIVQANPELDAALANLLTLEAETERSFEACDKWDKALQHYNHLAGDKAAPSSSRPNFAAKDEACKQFVNFLNSGREQMEELAVHLNDLVTGASSESRLDVVSELATDHQELEAAFKTAPMLEAEFKAKVESDPRLQDDYVAFEGVVAHLRDTLGLSLAEQLREHPEYLPAINELEEMLPALESVQNIAEKASSTVEKLRNVADLAAGEAAGAIFQPEEPEEEPAHEPQPEPEVVPEPAAPKLKPSEMAKLLPQTN